MRVWPALLAALWLAGCGGMQEHPGQDGALGPPLREFVADGRVSLRQGARSDHLQFDWSHGPGHDVLLFLSPLGQGLGELSRDTGGARLVLPGQAERRAPDLSSLAQGLFGASLPLDILAEWLRGARPDLSGEIDGWRIVVTETAALGQRRLPRRLEARRDDIELRIVIDNWGEGD